MRVIFRTNIDAYNEKNCLPSNFEAVPRKGEFVQVKNSFMSYYRNQKLPIRLEVVAVTWFENIDQETTALCELWYNETDAKMAKLAGAEIL